MDALDRLIVNELQEGIGLEESPFAACAGRLGMSEDDIVERVGRLLEEGVLTRFGPLYDVEALGGLFTLAAMRVPRERFDAVAATVNAHPEIAHNYEREHEYNMWFVVAAEDPEGVRRVLGEIERETDCEVLDLPRLEAYGLNLRLEAR
jgi:DNA-binding Lrp family transcriptional regulator